MQGTRNPITSPPPIPSFSFHLIQFRTQSDNLLWNPSPSRKVLIKDTMSQPKKLRIGATNSISALQDQSLVIGHDSQVRSALKEGDYTRFNPIFTDKCCHIRACEDGNDAKAVFVRPQRKSPHRAPLVLGLRCQGFLGSRTVPVLADVSKQPERTNVLNPGQTLTEKARLKPPPVGFASSPTSLTCRLGLSWDTTTVISSECLLMIQT